VYRQKMNNRFKIPDKEKLGYFELGGGRRA